MPPNQSRTSSESSSSSSTLVSPTLPLKEIAQVKMGSVESDSEHVSRLIRDYPAAVTDLYGLPTAPLTVFKSGADWPVSMDSDHPYIRELRPVYDSLLADHWDKSLMDYAECLDDLEFHLSAMDIVGFANRGERDPFCKAVVWVAVSPRTLTCGLAETGAKAVKHRLSQAGFQHLEVAFHESQSFFGGRRQLLSFKDEDAIVPRPVVGECRKPFTPVPGVAIARYDSPTYEGTAGFYYRLGDNDDGVLLLTAAHVVRPPPLFPNDGLAKPGQKREEVIILGDSGFTKATDAVRDQIMVLERSITRWKRALDRIPERVEGEAQEVADERNLYESLVKTTGRDIQSLRKLQGEVTTYRTNTADRKIGFIQSAEPIVVADPPHGFTRDFALIKIYKDAIDWNTFLGNKVYVHGNLSVDDYGSLLFPRPEDSKHYMNPDDGLLQARGVVQDGELRKPQHLDVNGEKCIFVVKNGMATGATVGRANGLMSFVRRIDAYNISHSSFEVAILPYDEKRGPFSDDGDSGAIILDRNGRIVALLNGGQRSQNSGSDITYGSPYWWVEGVIKGMHPTCQRYPIV